MPKTYADHHLFISKPFFLLFLLALLLGILYFASFIKSMSEPVRNSRLLATEVDFNATGDYDPSETTAIFLDQTISVPPEEHSDVSVLGERTDVDLATTSEAEPTPTAAKRIEVDLSAQRLYAFEGDRKVFDFLISSGKYGRTPTGTFRIWSKFRYTKMSGGSKELGTYYYLPNVPFVMFFSNNEVAASRGFSLHGTYWHNNFGHPMSHGCVNMKTEEVEQLYYWATPTLPEGKNSGSATKDNPGTEIIIYGTPPAQ
jgi:lipoprotein-anchoring transpeptidase ErfK/SrfK